MITLHQWARLFYTLATQPMAPYPRFDGRVETSRQFGLSYYLAPRHNRVEGDNSWFADTIEGLQDTKSLGTVQDYSRTYLLFLVHWGHYLWNARSVSMTPLKRSAFMLLRLLEPLIQQFDVALAHYVRQFGERFDANPVLAQEQPFFMGQQEQLDTARYDEHLAQLLSNKYFKQYVTRTMHKSLRPFAATGEFQLLGHCAKHTYDEKDCDLCNLLRWTRQNTILLNPFYLQNSVRASLEIVSPDYYADTNPWHAELRHWLSCLRADEGVYRLADDSRRGDRIVVNFTQLLAEAKKQCRPSHFLKLLDVQSLDETNLREKAVLARQIFEAQFTNRLSPRCSDIKGPMELAGWEWSESAQQRFGIYSTPRILDYLMDGKRKSQRAIVQKSRAPARMRVLKRPLVANAVFTDSVFKRHDIQIVRRIAKDGYTVFKANYYSLPYVLDPKHDTQELRRNCVTRVNGVLFWTQRGIYKHTKIKLDDNSPAYLLAEEFSRWVVVKDSELDNKGFNALRRKDDYPDRVAAVVRGERERVGAYLPFEDEYIVAALLSREKKLRFSDKEWIALMAQLPGRSQRSILRRIEQMGLTYAKGNGWVAYTRSHFCFLVSSTRRKAWFREGVRA